MLNLDQTFPFPTTSDILFHRREGSPLSVAFMKVTIVAARLSVLGLGSGVLTALAQTDFRFTRTLPPIARLAAQWGALR